MAEYGGGQGTATVHLRCCLIQNAHVVEIRDGVLMLAMAGVGARTLAKGGSQDVLREALVESSAWGPADRDDGRPGRRSGPSAGAPPATDGPDDPSPAPSAPIPLTVAEPPRVTPRIGYVCGMPS